MSKQLETENTSTARTLRDRAKQIAQEESRLREGGGKAGLERQHRLGRLFVRERLARLLDDPQSFFELGLWNAYGMYSEWGEVPAAGVVVGIGEVHGKPCMIVANDATVKAGVFFPQTAKKIIRAQRIAFENNLPLIYLVDSAGIFLPLQDEVFPDEDDFGRIFRNNAVLTAAGVPQIAAIMGNCVAGGAYLPVLCDKILMTEGSGLYLAGPSLVKAAIGQTVEQEELGGARMHAEISGTVDFREPNDEACIDRLKSLIELVPPLAVSQTDPRSDVHKPERSPDDVHEIISLDGRKEYDARDLLRCIVDAHTVNEYKADYGLSLVCAYAKIGGTSVGIVANQRTRTKSKKTGIQIGGVIYADAADKAARFIMDCNQSALPIIFIQDVTGFMVGRDSEQQGIIRSGAKLVNAMSNCVVPKITMIVGGSFGAGNYAMCGKAFDPRFIFAWPNARFAVMGAEQASETLFAILSKAQSRKSKGGDNGDLEALKKKVKANYSEQTDIRYAAARGWVDAIVQPEQTREVLIRTLSFVKRPQPKGAAFHTGVLQTSMSHRVTICEMSPRDGMQSVNRDCRIPIELRLALIDALKRARFPYIEAASFVSPKVFPQFADSVEVLTRAGWYDVGQLAALVPNLKYYDQYKSTPNLRCVAVFLSASDEYSRKNKRISLDDDLADAKQIAVAARSNGHAIRAHVSGAFRDLTSENRETDPRQVERVCRELIAAGCETVALADTDGRATTSDLQRVISHLRDAKIDITKIGVHLHDRDGHATENAREAFRLGIRTFDSAVGGIGGNRASADYVGNIATERLVGLFAGADLGIEMSALHEAQQIVSQMVEISER